LLQLYRHTESRKLRMNKVIPTVFFAAGLVVNVFAASIEVDAPVLNRDPFVQPVDGVMPSMMGSSEEIVKDVPVLQRFPLVGLQLVGVIESKRGSLSVIRAPDGRDYFAMRGARLGHERARISKIKKLSLVLTVDDQPMYLMRVNKKVSLYAP